MKKQNRILIKHRLFPLATCLLFGMGVHIQPMLAINDEFGTEYPSSVSDDLINVTGKVVDSSGIPVIGASIVEVGTTNGIITDFDGNFSLQVAAGVKLQISYIGYQTQEIVVSDDKSLNIVLKEDTEVLDEVVVVGYGSQKKVTLTGAISSVQSDDIVSTKNENVANMLSGKVAGFRVVQRTSEPGTLDATYNIRGMGSPLIVIDGVPGESSDLARLNAEEIESLTILKDASAAVYGVRAANGVVLVTTKQGKEGKVKFKYDGSFSIQTPTNEPTLLDAPEWMTLYNEWTRNSTPGLGADNVYSPEDIAAYANGTKQQSDWYGVSMNNSAPMTQHNISLSGGSKDVKYYASFGYLGQKGLANTGIQQYDRFNLRANVSAKIAEGLTTNLKVAGMKDSQQTPAGGIAEVYGAMWRQIPMNPIYVADGMAFSGFDNKNPVVMVDESETGYLRNYSGQFSVVGDVNWEIPWVKGLSAKALYSYEHRFTENRLFAKQYRLYNEDLSFVESKEKSKLTRTYTPRNNELFQLSLNYKKRFGNHDINALFLYEESKRQSDNFWVSKYFDLDVLDELFAGLDGNTTGNTDTGKLFENVNKGLVGRVNYSYADRYLLELSFRYDGSSKFMKGNQWGFFPATSFGWRVSEENFWKESVIADYVTNLKLRGSYGVMGDDAASSYQWLAGYTYPSGRVVWDREYVNGLATTGIPNKNITWYKAKTLDLGFDFTIQNGLFDVQFDWFKRNRSGLLATRVGSVPGVFGASFGQENLNTDMTTGFEVVLTHNKTINDFRYSVSMNLGYARSKQKHVEMAPSTDQRNNWLNNTNDRWANILWGYGYEGQFSSVEEAWLWASYGAINKNLSGNQYVLPGDIKYEDWNEDGVIDENDKHPIGIMDGQGHSYQDNKHQPLWNYGITLSGEYKGFDLNCLFQGAAATWFYYESYFQKPLNWSGNANGLDQFMDRWHTKDDAVNPFDPNSEWVGGEYPSTRETNVIHYDLDYLTNWNLEKTWYLRLKSIELGYTLPKSVCSKMGLEKLRFYVNAYNLLTFTNLKHIDPERPTSSHSTVYPLMKTYNFGVNLSF